MTIRDELVSLQERDGLLKPEVAVEWARSHPRSALHSAIDWDDTSAAHSYRIWQVRQLIAIHVVNKEGIRQIVSLSIDRRDDGGGYRSLPDVMASPSLREVLLADALAELERVRLKYATLQELARVWVEVRRVKQAKRSLVKPSRAQRSKGKQAKRSRAERSRAYPSQVMQA